MTSQPIKIFHIIVAPAIGGAERLLLTLARESDTARLDIVLGIFTHKTNDILFREAQNSGLAAVPIPITRAYGMQQLQALYGAIKKHRPDIIHTHGYKTNILGFAMAKLFGLPIITTVHGWMESKKTSTALLYHLCLRLLPFFDAVVAVSDSMREALERRGVPAHKLTTLRNIPAILQPSASCDDFRKRFGIPKTAKLVGFVGRLETVKGCRLFVQAAALAATSPDIRFAVVGEGRERAALENLARELGLQKRLVFCGYQSEMSPVYASLNLCVLSSLQEGLPLTLLEAMYCGVPIIATRVGGIPEVIRDGWNGILVEPDDHRGLAEKIILSLHDESAAVRRAREGRKTVETEYSVTTWSHRMECLYSSVLGTARCCP